VTIISSFTADEDSISQHAQPALSSAPATPQVWGEYQEAPPKIDIEPEPAAMEAALPAENIPFEEPAENEAAPPPTLLPSKPEPVFNASQKKSVPAKEEKSAAEKSIQAKQEVLQFEPVTRGRFEKSEPTIVEGEDLDVPTYLRKNIRVK